MDIKHPIEFKANKFWFIAIHIIGGIFAVFVGAFVLFIYHKSEIILLEISIFLLPLIITGFFIFFADTSKYDIILRANEIEGPIRFKSRNKRISVSYEDIDFYSSRKRIIFRDGFIATKNGHRILIFSRYFSKRDENQIFDKLKLGVKNDMRKEIRLLKKKLEKMKE